jgi:hypothetical protein
VLGGRPGPPQRDPFLLRLGEQVGGQPDRAGPLKPCDLAQQRVEPGRAGITAELGEQAQPATDRLLDSAALGVLVDQLLEPLDRNLWEPCHGPLAEPLVRDPPGAADHPADSAGRLQALLTAAGQQRVALALLSDFYRAHLPRQPFGQPQLISPCRLAEAERTADLRPGGT